MNWIISANGKYYNHKEAFNHFGFIDWKQNGNYSLNDIVYIYCTTPVKKIKYKTIVEKVNMSKDEIVNDEDFWKMNNSYNKNFKYFRLRLIGETDSNFLSLDNLKKIGLKSAPQNKVQINSEISNYIEKHFKEADYDCFFPDSDLSEIFFEGAKQKVYVNRYERSAKVRDETIKLKGSKCIVCGFDFEKIYGEIVKNFIHIHHIIPLSEINHEYKVNYDKDLIPVCPNCHAMLHRTINGKSYTYKELKELIKK